MLLSLRTEFVNKSLSVFPCSSFLFPVKSLYNLDEDETQGAIAINLLPLVSQSNVGRVTVGMSSHSRRYFDIKLWHDCRGKGIVFIWCTSLLHWAENLTVLSVLFLLLLFDVFR